MSISQQLRSMSESYADSTAQRAFIQTIPIVGGAIDTLMSGMGSQIQKDRFYALLDALAKRLDTLEESRKIEPSEELFDLLRVAIENSVRTRSEDKRERFANIIANKVVSDEKSWDDAETAMRLIAELSDIHFKVLQTVHTAPDIGDVLTDNMRVVSLNRVEPFITNEKVPLYLPESLSEYTRESLSVACLELKAKGLLENPSILGSPAEPNKYILSSLGDWLINWTNLS